MKSTPSRATSILLGVLGLAACASTGTTDASGSQTCRAKAAAALIGKPAPDDATIQRRTRSASVRRLAPGDAATRDFRLERITLTIADGRIVAASCG